MDKSDCNQERFIYSGHPEDDAEHTEGVAFMMDKEAQ